MLILRASALKPDSIFMANLQRAPLQPHGNPNVPRKINVARASEASAAIHHAGTAAVCLAVCLRSGLMT